jgi:hypothetical protein
MRVLVFVEAVLVFSRLHRRGHQSRPMHINYGFDARSASHETARTITNAMKKM